MSATDTAIHTQHRVFILADAGENNNKFWEAYLLPTGVRCKWGRVDTKGQEKFYPGEGVYEFEKRIREKVGKGYTEVALLEHRGATPAGVVDKKMLSKVAQDQIAGGDPELTALVARLAEANRHEIVQATGGAITFNAQGMAQTALGIVQRDSVRQARTYLNAIAREVMANRIDDAESLKAISAYMRLIPQKVGARRGWHVDVFGSAALLDKQYDLLDKLEQSIEQAEKAVDDAIAAKANGPVAQQKVFEVKLTKLTDKREIARINRMFTSSINKHHHGTSHLSIKNIYVVEIPSMRKAYEADGGKLGNVRELWHGTRVFNVLSILKSGLVIPKSNAGHVTGRMFGDGLYFSDQSTKSANYSAGYWDGTMARSGADNNCFMFLADVAMGREYVPPGRVDRPPHGYDSVFAKAGKSSVMNNEMIVYRLGQANLKYLLELC